MNTVTLAGPLGDFLIPAGPPKTREVCEFLTKLLWSGEYDHDAIGEPDVILDIGAGWGGFAVWAAARWPRARRIICIEPHRQAFDLLKVNAAKIALSSPDRTVEFIEAAVTSDPDAVYSCHEDWGAGRTHGQTSGVRVPIIHPRDLPPCDLAKCDAEGVEAEVLACYAHWAGLKALIYEWHDRSLHDHCQAICEVRGGMRLASEHPGPWGMDQGDAVWLPARA
jgi:FkbM family methyltransferase